MDMVVPLYDFVGIPFQGAATEPFHKLLQSYVLDVYIEQIGKEPLQLDTKRDRLLRAIDNAYNSAWRDEYVTWLLHVFVHRVGEHTAGWSQWRTVFMRCSVRSGWWQRLNLPVEKDAFVQRELADAKARMDDARELTRSIMNGSLSDWDKRVLKLLRIDEDAREAGEPFNRILLTASFFLFYLFWVRLVKLLSAAEMMSVWEATKTIGPDLGIKPEDIPDPRQLRLISP